MSFCSCQRSAFIPGRDSSGAEKVAVNKRNHHDDDDDGDCKRMKNTGAPDGDDGGDSESAKTSFQVRGLLRVMSQMCP